MPTDKEMISALRSAHYVLKDLVSPSYCDWCDTRGDIDDPGLGIKHKKSCAFRKVDAAIRAEKSRKRRANNG